MEEWAKISCALYNRSNELVLVLEYSMPINVWNLKATHTAHTVPFILKHNLKVSTVTHYTRLHNGETDERDMWCTG